MAGIKDEYPRLVGNEIVKVVRGCILILCPAHNLASLFIDWLLHLIIHSFNGYLLSLYYILGICLSIENTDMSKKNSEPMFTVHVA